MTGRHGTIASYTYDRCRCVDCSDAWRAYQREWKAKRLADPSKPHDRVKYVSGCRCDTCRAANAAYNLRRKDRLADSDSIPHGTVDGYGSYRCRCDECSAAKRSATRDHYVRNQLYFLEKAERRMVQKARDRRTITSRDIARLVARHDGKCAYCDKPGPVELDHVVPLARGGRHAIGNLLPACMRCNRSKNARLLIEWKGRPRG